MGSSNNYNLVVVQIEVSRVALEKRLHNREGDKVAHVLSVLDFYKNQHQELSRIIKADIILKEDYNLDKAAKRIAEKALGE